jgi:ribosomal protein L34
MLHAPHLLARMDTTSGTQIVGTKKHQQRHQKCRQRFFKA